MRYQRRSQSGRNQCICFLWDFLGHALPVPGYCQRVFTCFLGVRILKTERLFFAAVIAAPVLGHAIAPFNHFHGGKCISTAFGALLGLYPLTKIVFLLAGIYIALSTIFVIPSTRLRSMLPMFSKFRTFSRLHIKMRLIPHNARDWPHYLDTSVSLPS